MGHFFFILIDAYTKWPEVHIVKNITAKTTIELCRKIFATFGLPKQFVSDNGTTFTSSEFSLFLKKNGITQKFTAPYNPFTNGQAERFVQTIKNSLRRIRTEKANIQVALQILLQYRNAQQATTGKSPAELMFSRKLRTRLDLLFPTKEERRDDTEVSFSFKEGERVSCRNYLGKEKWGFGKVSKRLGKLHYSVEMDDGRMWKRHIN